MILLKHYGTINCLHDHDFSIQCSRTIISLLSMFILCSVGCINICWRPKITHAIICAGLRKDTVVRPDSPGSPVTCIRRTVDHAVEGASTRKSDRYVSPTKRTRDYEGRDYRRSTTDQDIIFDDSEEHRVHRRRSSLGRTSWHRSRSKSPYSPDAIYEVCSF